MKLDYSTEWNFLLNVVKLYLKMKLEYQSECNCNLQIMKDEVIKEIWEMKWRDEEWEVEALIIGYL